ncbi:hypothetical protein NUW58_g3510 [Xylaria curta]|uniref:Uncharacterized protein n=1 Tax=Xylaria curta TaxID=42375 RepID=A0ACC1PAP0_9PEZI|nr:hypothetical protein NUW58_g3510 [Xylaria curta]
MAAGFLFWRWNLGGANAEREEASFKEPGASVGTLASLRVVSLLMTRDELSMRDAELTVWAGCVLTLELTGRYLGDVTGASFNWQSIEVNGGAIAFDILGFGGGTGQGIGSISLIDSSINDLPVGILTNGLSTSAQHRPVGRTVFIPTSSRAQGSSCSQIQGSGYYFGDMHGPNVIMQVGNKGGIGIMEIVEMLLSVQDNTANAVLMEWSVAGANQGDAAM